MPATLAPTGICNIPTISINQRVSAEVLGSSDDALKLAPHGHPPQSSQPAPSLQAAKAITVPLKKAPPHLQAVKTPKARTVPLEPAPPRLKAAKEAARTVPSQPAQPYLKAAQAQPLPQGSPLLVAAAAAVVQAAEAQQPATSPR